MIINSKKWGRMKWLLISTLALAGVMLITGNPLLGMARSDEKLDARKEGVNHSAESVTINGISMEVIGVHQEGEFFQVDVCYSLPDTRDWILTSRPEDAVLQVNDQGYVLHEEGLLSMNFSPQGAPQARCQYLRYPVSLTNDTHLVFTLEKIYVSEPERVDCDALQKQLDERKSGISIQCPSDPQMGGGQHPSKAGVNASTSSA